MKFKRVFAMVLACCVCMALCACEIQTPNGTLNLQFDETKKSEQTKVVDEEGNETIIPTKSITEYVDALLNEVALPNGATTADLKAFIYDSLGVVGIDLEALDNGAGLEDVISEALEKSDIDLSNPEEIEQTIKDALEEQGIDTSEVELDLDAIAKSIEEGSKDAETDK